MPERDRLGTLQMRIARHHGVGVLLGFFAKHRDKLRQLRVQIVARFAQIQPDIQSNLVVAAARGVQAFARRADAGGQLPFHERVNILCVRVDFKLTAFNIFADGLKPL